MTTAATAHPDVREEWRDVLTDLARAYHDASDYETGDGCNPDRMRQVRQTVEEWADPPRIIGRGEGRLVGLLPDKALDTPHPQRNYVVKLPLAGEPHGDPNVAGLAQNGHERFVWEETRSDHLVPVVDYHPDDWWLVMPQGTPTSGDDVDGFESWAETARDDLHEFITPREVTSRNSVLIDFQPKLCDYGYPPEDDHFY